MDKLRKALGGIKGKLTAMMVAAMLIIPSAAFAEEGAGAGAAAASKIINDQIGGLTSAATPIITGALSVAALFFAAKFLWTKFKSIAR